MGLFLLWSVGLIELGHRVWQDPLALWGSIQREVDFIQLLHPVNWVVVCTAEPIDHVGFLLAWSVLLVAAKPNELGFYGYNRTHSSREVFLSTWIGPLAAGPDALGLLCRLFLGFSVGFFLTFFRFGLPKKQPSTLSPPSVWACIARSCMSLVSNLLHHWDGWLETHLIWMPTYQLIFCQCSWTRVVLVSHAYDLVSCCWGRWGYGWTQIRMTLSFESFCHVDSSLMLVH